MKQIRKIFTTEDGSASLIDLELDETYHSRHGALSESLHVFIEHGLIQAKISRHNLRILEIGFGTGLNAWLTWIEAIRQNLSVFYCGLEPYPIDETLLQELNYYAIHGKEKYKDHFHLIHHVDWDREVELEENFRLLKNSQTIQQFECSGKFDLVYFDAFAPQKQPEMWEYPVLEKVCDKIDQGGILVTYCARGQFKRDLKKLGMQVESPPGPPGKREMVRATKL